MKKIIFNSLTRLLGLAFLWMNLGHAPDLHAQTRKFKQDFNSLQTAGNDHPAALWSDGTIIWVSDYEDDKLYAYDLNTKARVLEKEFNTLQDAENVNPRGLWSNGTIMWVADWLREKIYAYDLNTQARVPDEDFDNLQTAGNLDPAGIWSDGTTLWVVDRRRNKIFAYNLESKVWDSDKDFDRLFPTGNLTPRDIWSDGKTMWVSDWDDGNIYAYDLNTQAWDPSQSLNSLDVENAQTLGIWSDGTTMWTVDVDDRKLYAYTLAVKAPRDDTKDLNTLDLEDVEFAGLWSDRTTMWVADDLSDKLYAYTLATMARDSEKDFNMLATAGNTDPRGLWSDGTTMWVTDIRDFKLYAYTLATMARDTDNDLMLDAENTTPEGLWSDGITMWVMDRDGKKLYAYDLNTQARDTDNDLTLDAATGSEPFGLWSDGTTMWVTESGNRTLWAYNLATKTRESGSDFNEFDAENINPRGLWSNGTTMWVSDSNTDALFAYDLPKKSQTITFSLSSMIFVGGDMLDLPATASSGLPVSYVSLDPSIAEVGRGGEAGKLILKAAGTTTITASQAGNDEYDAARTRSHNITVRPSRNFTENTESSGFYIGLWSDGITMWVADLLGAKLYAYTLATMARDSEKDFNTLDAGNTSPRGLWSDGTTMWVADNDTDILYAYTLATQAREPANDLTLAADNDKAIGIWSDGTTMWVVDADDEKLYAYNLATKAREPGNDLTLATGNRDPYGLWSNGTTMWVANDSDSGLGSYQLYAYNLEGKTRDENKDLHTLVAENDNPQGLWSDGTTMWVADWSKKIYSYALRNSQTIIFDLSDLTGTVGEELDLSATATSGLPVSYVSSNPSIAEVGTGGKAGKLILKAGGTATITARQAGNDEYTAAGEMTQSITIEGAITSKEAQIITFTLPDDITRRIGEELDLSAMTDSGLPVSYESLDASIVEVGTGDKAGKLILKAAGTTTITASQAGNDQYDAAPNVTQDITVSKNLQTIAFTLSDLTGTIGEELDLSAMTDSGLPVSYESLDASIAEVGTGDKAGKLILKAAGTTTITASQAGDDQYLVATNVTQDITVSKNLQTIAFTLSDLTGTIGEELDLSAMATSGLPVSYVSSDPDVAEVMGDKLILKAGGDAVITASQAGDDQYLVATNVTQDITVKKTQTITFILPHIGTVDDMLDLSAIADASSGLEITYESSRPDFAEVRGDKLILKSVGDAVITASQVGDNEYDVAPNVTRNIRVEKKTQTITLTLPDEGFVGDTLILSATASSGLLEITYVSSDPDVAEVIEGDKLIFKEVGDGFVGITASQAGNAQYNQASSVLVYIRVEKKLQTITFDLPTTGFVGDMLDLSATASSKLDVTYSSSDPDVAEVMGDNLILKSVGPATITARQAGNYQYNQANPMFGNIRVEKKTQTITFTLPDEGFVGDMLDLSATASSKLDVTYVINPPAAAEVIEGDKLILKAENSGISIIAKQVGNDEYDPALEQRRDVTVSKKSQTITFTLPTTGFVGDMLDLSATASSKLDVTYSSADPSRAEVGTGINADKLILKTAGPTTITASQGGNYQYNRVSQPSSQDITISKKSQTIAFDLPTTGFVGDTLDLSATATSKLDITYVISPPAAAEVIEGDKLILKSEGPLAIHADQGGNYQYDPAIDVRRDINVSKRTQTISFTLPDEGFVGEMLDLSATTDSGLDITYSSSAPSIAEVGTGDKAGKLILKERGNATITANQVGNDQYAIATESDVISVNKRTQTISFTLPDEGFVGEMLDLSAMTDSGLDITYESSDPDIAEVRAGKLILKAGGNAVITARQAGNTTYDNASMDHEISVDLRPQTITFTLPNAGSVGDMLELSAMATSGLDVSYLSTSPNVAEVRGDKLILKEKGVAAIYASQMGNDEYHEAINVRRDVTVGKRPQTITFDLPTTGFVGDMLDLSATASSGLDITYESSNASRAEVRGDELFLKAEGDAMITARQLGNDEYAEAFESLSVGVSRRTQTISFILPDEGEVGDTLDLLATTDSGLDITYESLDASIAEVGTGDKAGKLFLKAAGPVTITARQLGNDEYAEAFESLSVGVSRKTQTISFILPDAGIGFVGGMLDLSATASSELDITYESSDPDIAEVSGDELILKAEGTSTITARQAGNITYDEVFKNRDVIVSRNPQTITFTLPHRGMVDDTLALSATASSGLDVTYSSSHPGVAEVSGDELILKTIGDATITVSQAGDTKYVPATNVPQFITVGKNPQTITFILKTTGMVGEVLTLSATTDSELDITYSSSHPGVAEVSGDELTLKTEGSSTITASQVGNAKYLVAMDVPQLITIGKNPQIITFDLPHTGMVDEMLALSAMTDSGLDITYSSSHPEIAEVRGDNLILKAIGDATITVSQLGNDEYAPAREVNRLITVGKTPQTIIFAMITVSGFPHRGMVDDTLTLSAMTDSGLEVSYVSLDPSIAEVGTGMNAGKLILKAVGNTTITAIQTGDAKYAPAVEVVQRIIVDKNPQTITFALPHRGMVDDTLALSATTDSGLDITYSSSDSDVAEVSGDELILKAGGTSTITASQAGDAKYLVATDVTQDITVGKKPQMITFTLSTGVVDDTLDLSAMTGSGLDITYSSSDSDVAEVRGDKLILKVVGTSTITASQAGNPQYLAATDMTQDITVGKKPQIITFTLSTGVVGDTLDLSDIAEASSMLEVSYVSSDSDVAEVRGDKLILKTVGTSTITASQAGDAKYLVATDVTQDITVSKKPQTITFTLSTGVVGDTLDLSDIAEASSMLEVSYMVSSNSDIAEVGTGINADKLILKVVGSVIITASQEGDAKYLAATDVTQDITISKKPQTITFTLSTGVVGDTLDLSAMATSMLDVTYSSSDSEVAKVRGDKLILKAVGTSTITASQAGDAKYLVATDVTQDITVSKRPQMITFTLSTGVVGDTLALSAMATSMLDVTYSSSDSDVAEVRGDKLILKAVGSVTITASQAGDAKYLVATDVTQDITVSKRPQMITFTLSTTGFVGDTLDLSAMTDSGLDIAYSSSDSDVAEVRGDKLILKAVGTSTITASQAGDAKYLVAMDMTQSITVSGKEVLSVDVGNTDIRVWPNPVTTQLNISSGRKIKITITLSNLTGQRLQEEELEGKGQIDVSHLPEGVYLLYIRTKEETTSYLIYKE